MHIIVHENIKKLILNKNFQSNISIRSLKVDNSMRRVNKNSSWTLSVQNCSIENRERIWHVHSNQ